MLLIECSPLSVTLLWLNSWRHFYNFSHSTNHFGPPSCLYERFHASTRCTVSIGRADLDLTFDTYHFPVAWLSHFLSANTRFSYNGALFKTFQHTQCVNVSRSPNKSSESQSLVLIRTQSHSLPPLTPPGGSPMLCESQVYALPTYGVKLPS